MSDYPCEIREIHNAVVAAAVRHAATIRDSLWAPAHTYSHLTNVRHSEILVPGEPAAHTAMRDRALLWGAADAVAERRTQATAQELVVALPPALSLAEHADLVRTFVSTTLLPHGLVADIAIHDPHAESADTSTYHSRWGLACGIAERPHAHIMMPVRGLDMTERGTEIWLGLEIRLVYAPMQEKWSRSCAKALLALADECGIRSSLSMMQDLLEDDDDSLMVAGPTITWTARPDDEPAEAPPASGLGWLGRLLIRLGAPLAAYETSLPTKRRIALAITEIKARRN